MENNIPKKRNSNVKEEQEFQSSKTNQTESLSLGLTNHEPQHEEKPMTLEEYKKLKAKEKANYWCLGGDITDKRINKGKDKKDNDGNVLTDTSGAVLTWDDKYYVTLSFVGGSEEFEVKEEQFNSINEGESYYFEGRYTNRKMFGKDQLIKEIKTYELLP